MLESKGISDFRIFGLRSSALAVAARLPAKVKKASARAAFAECGQSANQKILKSQLR
jgi:hypothetical protein